MEVSGLLHVLDALPPPPPEKRQRYPLDRRMGGPQSQSGRGEEKHSSSYPCREWNSEHSSTNAAHKIISSRRLGSR